LYKKIIVKFKEEAVECSEENQDVSSIFYCLMMEAVLPSLQIIRRLVIMTQNDAEAATRTGLKENMRTICKVILCCTVCPHYSVGVLSAAHFRKWLVLRLEFPWQLEPVSGSYKHLRCE
jgi:hypothetical protein